jgi:mannosyl-oligosaccharide alpha-1,2-mannosidase
MRLFDPVPRYSFSPILVVFAVSSSALVFIVFLSRADGVNDPGSFWSGAMNFQRLLSRKFSFDLYPRPFPKVAPDPEKMSAIKEAFMHAWSHYSHFCFGQDELLPLSGQCANQLHGGLTIIDSLSTLILMNLTTELKRARTFIETAFHPSGQWSLFEFMIRIVGGLLSAGELAGDSLFIDTAVALGRAVLPLIEERGGFFNSAFTIRSVGPLQFTVTDRSGDWCLAEVGTFQLEFLTLTRLTNDPRFAKVAMSVYCKLWNADPDRGLISRNIGAGHDSYYEYVIKSYLLTGGVSKKLLERHMMIVRDIKSQLLFKTIHENLTGIGELSEPMMEHLATFAAGMLAIGTVVSNTKNVEDLILAAELADTYAAVYRGMKAGLMPERVRYNVNNPRDPRVFWSLNPRYLLRPETVESIYVIWKFTGLQKYRDYAWEIFCAINRSCRVPYGFAAIPNVDLDRVKHSNSMESFFLAETLKYLYLIFCDSQLLSPGEWVFNTEAHPLKIWNQSTIKQFGALVRLEEWGTEKPPRHGANRGRGNSNTKFANSKAERPDFAKRKAGQSRREGSSDDG